MAEKEWRSLHMQFLSCYKPQPIIYIVALSQLPRPFAANAAFKVKWNWVAVSWRDFNDVICLLSSLTGKEIYHSAVYEGCTDVC